jgi:hypothetical protein
MAMMAMTTSSSMRVKAVPVYPPRPGTFLKENEWREWGCPIGLDPVPMPMAGDVACSSFIIRRPCQCASLKSNGNCLLEGSFPEWQVAPVFATGDVIL